MRISDWSSDVCSSDLAVVAVILAPGEVAASSPAAKSAVKPALAPVAASPASAPAPVVSAPVAVRRALDPFNAVHTPEHNFGPAALSNGIKVTPLARRLAAERSIDLATVAGSGPNGRIVADDIREIGRASCRERVCQYV